MTPVKRMIGESYERSKFLSPQHRRVILSVNNIDE